MMKIKLGEKIFLSGGIEIVVTEAARSVNGFTTVKIGIEAPREVEIVRESAKHKRPFIKENRDAANGTQADAHPAPEDQRPDPDLQV